MENVRRAITFIKKKKKIDIISVSSAPDGLFSGEQGDS